MFSKTCHLGLPRRIVVYYLLFCIAAIVSLGVGAVVVSQRVMTSRADSTCLTLLGKAASEIELALLRRRPTELQSLVERVRSEGSLVYCAVASADGTFLAHSRRGWRGKKFAEPVGNETQWGDVHRVRFVDAEGHILREYRTPLKTAGQLSGWLRIAVTEPSLGSTSWAVATHAPLAILIPLACVVAGAVLLRRMVQPLSDIEAQLQQLAVSAAPALANLRQVKVSNAASLGWNRLVDGLADRGQREALPDRLAAAVRQRRQDHLQSVLHSLADGLAVTDAQGRITFANRAIAALLGSQDERGGLQGESLEQLLLAEADATDGQLLGDPAARQRTVVAELPRKNAAGSRVLRASRHPVRNVEEEGGHVWSLRDVTQQKLAERMRDQFLDSATHELRTPLANIKAYAETLALTEMIDVERQKDFCNTINSEASRLARFIDDLLDLSSMEVGSLSVRRQQVELKRLLHEVVDKVRPLMDQKGLSFEVRIPEKLPDLHLDKDKVASALVNLLGNAVKYTPDGGRVAFKAAVSEDHLQIDVEDSGLGIAAGELDQIFDKFFRSADPRIRQEAGTGLGLSLAQEVIRLHGGDVTVRSELDRGSTFTVSLPVR